jgi:plasmid stabilization system protein ParE
MNQHRVSDAARSDLDEIWLYIAQDNPDAADKLMRGLVSRFPLLASMPGNGTAMRGICGPIAKFSRRQLRYLLPSDGKRR